MIDEGDKVDPARTELTIQRSLEKASERRVWFRPSDDAGEWVTVRTSTMRQAVDEIERLRAWVIEMSVKAGKLIDERDKFWRERDEAEDEVEALKTRVLELEDFLAIGNEQQVAVENENGELRGIIQQAADDVVAASYPRQMHLEWLEAARKVLAKDD